MHDHFLPYRRLDTVDHAFCNAHILRELQSLIEFDKEPWAEAMRDMLREANLAVNKAREAGATALAPDELAAFVDRYWAAVRLGLAFHRELPKLATKANPRGRTKQRPGHNLLERRHCPGSIVRFANWHRQIFLDSGILFRFKDS